MKSTSLLSEDHKHLLRALKILEGMAVLVERGSKPNERDVKDILEFMVGFGDRIHQGREESILFPALLVDREQRNYPELCALIFAHNRQRSLVQGLQDSMLTKQATDFVYYAHQLVDILRIHIKDEENELFPLANSTLSPADDERIVNDMKAQDKAWQDQKLPPLLHRLGNLESKYSVKAAGHRGAA